MDSRPLQTQYRYNSKSGMYEYSEGKRPGAIARPSGLMSSKVIQSRSKSYSDLSNKQHLKSSMEEDTQQQQDGLYVAGWGRCKFHQYPQISWSVPVMEVACGEKHTLLLTSRFEMYACGDNQHGQLGIPVDTVTSVAVPTQLMRDRPVSGIYCGPYHSILQTSKGELYGMGLNNRGQLGLGNAQDQKMGPALIEALSAKRPNRETSRGRIVTTAQHQGILTDRQTSTDNLPNRDRTPEKRYRFFEGEELNKSLVEANEYVKQVVCGPFHSLALTSKGKVLATGLVILGAEPSANKHTLQFEDLGLKLGGVIEQVSTSMALCAARTSQSRVFLWGIFGEKYVLDQPTQAEVRGAIDVSLGGDQQCILNAKGEVYQLYCDDSVDRLKARKVEDLPHIRSVRCGADFALAIATESRQVYGWGKNRYGQITEGKPSNSLAIAPVVSRTQQAVKIFCGSYHAICLGKKPPTPREETNNEVSYSRKDSATEEQKQQEEDSSQKLRRAPQKKSIRTQTDPMSKFEMTSTLAARTFSTTLEIPFSEITLEKQISEGGYGIIYKGKWRQTTVAVKLFKIESSESSVKDFLSECHAMEALRHPNIVLFLGACTKPPNFAIVLEYCSKGTLWSMLQSTVQLSWEDRRRFALDTARGMNYLHACEVPILHRDLKSLNLLLDESYRVKLADFGWTKGLQNYMTEKIGTYQWMAPEVISGQKYTEKADVFSFGIILWEIASREPPYRNVSGIQVSIEVANNHLRPTVPKKTPEAFARLMKRCWDRNPDTRPSFKQIIRELEGMKLVQAK